MAGEMAVPGSPVPRFLNAMVDQLRLMPALTDVAIFSAAVGRDEGGHETIQLWTVEEEQAWMGVGGLRRESTWVTTGAVYAFRHGAGEEAIRAARDRAYELLACVEGLLRRTAQGVMMVDPENSPTAKACQFQSADLDQGAQPEGRWAAIQFTIAAEASTLPSPAG